MSICLEKWGQTKEKWSSGKTETGVLDVYGENLEEGYHLPSRKPLLREVKGFTLPV